jgi:chemotaxis protein MotA
LLVIIGYVVVMGSVFGGFALSGGHLGALFQPLELLMIGGAALALSWSVTTPRRSRPR